MEQESFVSCTNFSRLHYFTWNKKNVGKYSFRLSALPQNLGFEVS